MINTIKKIRRKLINNSRPLPKYYKICSLIEPNKKVLDFGCWQGDLSRIIIEKKNCKVVGCDIIKECSFKNKNFKYVKVDTKKNNFPFKERFDYIIFSDVLEHLENPAEILKRASKLADNLIISIPNINFFLFRLFPKLENPPKELTPHLHHWDIKSFTKVIPNEMRIRKIVYCTDFPELRIFNRLFPNSKFFNQTVILEISQE